MQFSFIDLGNHRIDIDANKQYLPLDTKLKNHIWCPSIAQKGDVAQLGERRVRNAKARGSIPLISTKT